MCDATPPPKKEYRAPRDRPARYRKRMKPEPKPFTYSEPIGPQLPNGLKVVPDVPHLERSDAHAIGNRVKKGSWGTDQSPAMAKAIALMKVPGEWEVVAFYQHEKRVKAAVWYLRHHVVPKLPRGTWEFERCWWEKSAVMGRFTFLALGAMVEPARAAPSDSTDEDGGQAGTLV